MVFASLFWSFPSSLSPSSPFPLSSSSPSSRSVHLSFTCHSLSFCFFFFFVFFSFVFLYCWLPLPLPPSLPVVCCPSSCVNSRLALDDAIRHRQLNISRFSPRVAGENDFLQSVINKVISAKEVNHKGQGKTRLQHTQSLYHLHSPTTVLDNLVIWVWTRHCGFFLYKWVNQWRSFLLRFLPENPHKSNAVISEKPIYPPPPSLSFLQLVSSLLLNLFSPDLLKLVINFLKFGVDLRTSWKTTGMLLPLWGNDDTQADLKQACMPKTIKKLLGHCHLTLAIRSLKTWKLRTLGSGLLSSDVPSRRLITGELGC